MSDFFLKTSEDLGIKNAGESITIEFPYHNISLITRIESPCDCTSVKNVPNQNKIVITYVPNSTPIHLKQEGQNWYQTAKVVKITYNTNGGVHGLEQKLVFTAKISG